MTEAQGAQTGGYKTIGVKLPDELHAQLTLVAQLDEMSLTDAIRAAIDGYLERKRSKATWPHERPRRSRRSSGTRRHAGTPCRRCSGTTPRPPPRRPGRPAGARRNRRHSDVSWGEGASVLLLLLPTYHFDLFPTQLISSSGAKEARAGTRGTVWPSSTGIQIRGKQRRADRRRLNGAAGCDAGPATGRRRRRAIEAAAAADEPTATRPTGERPVTEARRDGPILLFGLRPSGYRPDYRCRWRAAWSGGRRWWPTGWGCRATCPR